MEKEIGKENNIMIIVNYNLKENNLILFFWEF